MNAKGEQTLVGLFVIVAAGVLIATVFAISGAFGRSVTQRAGYLLRQAGIEKAANSVQTSLEGEPPCHHRCRDRHRRARATGGELRLSFRARAFRRAPE